MTRSMALQKASDQHHHDQGSEDWSGAEKMLADHHRNTLWIPWTLILLGAWLVVAPFTFGYLNEDLWTVPSGGRGAWFADEVRYLSLRAHLLAWSDVISGALLMVLGWRPCAPTSPSAGGRHASWVSGWSSHLSCCGRRRHLASSTTRWSGCSSSP